MPPLGMALFTLFFAAALGVARWAGRAARVRAPIHSRPAGPRIGLTVLMLGLPFTPWGFLGLEGLLLVLVAGWAGYELRQGPRGIPELPRLLGYTSLSLATLLYMHDRDLADGLVIGPELQYVLHDFASQVILPAVDAVGGPLARSTWVADVIAHTANGIAAAFPLVMATLTWAITMISARMGDHRSGIGRLRSPVLLAFPLLLLLQQLGAIGPTATAIVAAPLVLRAVVQLGSLLSGFHVRPVAVGLTLSLATFTPALAWALAGAGWALGVLVPPPPVDRPPSGDGLVASAAVAAAIMGGLGWIAVEQTTPALDDPARDLQACRDVTRHAEEDGVRYDGTSYDFIIDRQERALPGGSMQDAESACAAAGKRVCTSREVYVACLCGHADDQDAEALGRPWENAPMLDRWRRDCGDRPVADPAVCRSDDGVELILGGLSEVTADSVAGGRLVAGPNQALDESWMAGCTYRGLISEQEMERARFPFLGYRCCQGSAP